MFLIEGRQTVNKNRNRRRDCSMGDIVHLYFSRLSSLLRETHQRKVKNLCHSLPRFEIDISSLMKDVLMFQLDMGRKS